MGLLSSIMLQNIVAPMNSPTDRTGERIAFAIMSLFFYAFGWIALLEQGISIAGKRHPGSAYVTGNWSLFVAVISIAAGILCGVLLLRSCNQLKHTKIFVLLACSAPVAWWLLKY